MQAQQPEAAKSPSSHGVEPPHPASEIQETIKAPRSPHGSSCLPGRAAHSPGSAGDAARSLLAQANLDRLRGKLDEATDRCAAVLRAQADNAAAHSLLGDIYQDRGDLDEAIHWYRMAVEIAPTPADQSKLAQAELQREAEARRAARRQRLGYAPSACGAVGGTANLMGISPRRWLWGLWTASLGFLALVLIALIRLRPAAQPVPRVTSSGFGASATLLPPRTLTDLRTLASTRPRVDMAAASRRSPLTPAAGLAPPERSAQATWPATSPLPDRSPAAPAPVLGTTPVQGYQTTAPRDSQVATQSPPAALTDGMQVAQIYSGEGAEVIVTLSAPPQLLAENPAAARVAIARNLIRAAQMAFSQNGSYQAADLFVLAPVPDSSQPAAIVEANTDRAHMLGADVSTASLAELSARLTSLKWNGPLSSDAEQQPAAPAEPQGSGQP